MPRSSKRQKLDELVVALGLASNLTKARALIMAGEVVVDDQRVDKPGQLVPKNAVIRLKGQSSQYVGRGGDKLAGAMKDFGLEATFHGAVVLDVGASTGGFTDASLQAGAKKVIAVDVGTNQLAWSLRQDPRVTVLERTDIRDVNPRSLEPVDWVVVDVSFISLKALVDALVGLSFDRSVRYLLLVKPQFELERKLIPEGGVVESDTLRSQAVDSVVEKLRDRGVREVLVCDSRLPGREGNREVFIYFCTDQKDNG